MVVISVSAKKQRYRRILPLANEILQRLWNNFNISKYGVSAKSVIESAGMEEGGISMGLCDEERLARQFPLYDALYEYLRVENSKTTKA